MEGQEKKYKIVALIGESASGKDTYKKYICENTDDFNSIVSTTTRPPREGEVNGINYYFCTAEEFGVKILDFSMLEATDFNNWFYGTSLEALDENKINVGCFSPEGVRQLKEDSRIDLIVLYIKTSPKVRLMRSLNREESPDVDEIVRRYSTDAKDFADLDFEYIVINNNINNLTRVKAVAKVLALDLIRAKGDNALLKNFINIVNTP